MPESQLADPTDYGNPPGAGPKRPKGQAPDGPLTKADLPSARSEASEKQQPAVDMMRDLVAGNEAVKDAGTTYLPQAPGELGADYRDRLARSQFYAATGRTVEGLTGLIFRKDPELGEDVPAQIVELWENIDLEGTHGDVFCRELEADAIASGHAAIFVEYPNTGGAHGREAEISGEVRPYWIPIKKEDIMSWRTVKEGGVRILTQLVIRETDMVEKGEFGEEKQVRYRVLFRDPGGVVGYRLLMVREDNAVFEEESGFYPTQDEIPVAEIPTSGSVSLFESSPPLLDLGYTNVAHYQQWSDYAWSIHKTCVPFLFGAGIPEAKNADGTSKGEIVIGANTTFLATDSQAKMMYVSPDGAGLGASKQALDDLKDDMAKLGMAALAPQKMVAEKPEAKRLDKAAGDAPLSVTARALQDGVENALRITGRYLRGQPEGGSITINRDFEGLLMEAPVMSAVAQLVQAGFPVEMAAKMLQLGGRIPEDEDLDEVAMQWMMGQEMNQQIPPPEEELEEAA